jgi:hypothetical protein
MLGTQHNGKQKGHPEGWPQKDQLLKEPYKSGVEQNKYTPGDSSNTDSSTDSLTDTIPILSPEEHDNIFQKMKHGKPIIL